MEGLVISRHWPACSEGIQLPRASEDRLRRAIRDLGDLRSRLPLSTVGDAKVAQAITALREAADAEYALR